ncbi:ATP-dependent DNA helicase [Taibaiella sp. KBW10]|uniref:ATP-dependent helicase n=1 Tax=Taibaiella sp. KBW10 TaxID=2153357 RepID=UPI000F596EDD|nr:UvrD-helicase domain-containing protein [Taibaiella sp. KBW10]RQO30252.1 ATP-dependent DNA helicase [Taibaiella sp. KBW10]
MQHEYLSELNEQQRAAVSHLNGPLMIVAGAGSGKTKVLTTRIAHLMRNGVDAFNILALTFTNKAAAEMKERIERILGNTEARNLYIGTFHSVFAKILRAEAPKIGYPNNFTIYDADDAKSLIRSIISENNLDDKIYKPNVIYSRISGAKNGLIGPAQYLSEPAIAQEDARANRPLTGQIYAQYANRCFKNGAMDFDDLLFKMYELLKTQAEVLAKYQHKFKYVLIDEYQDTNTAQYKIVKMLAAVNENICVVGDDAQSIYSFRGATIQNILQFQNDYDDVKVIKLEQNYRSTQSILNVANKIIGNNKNQIPKNLWTDNAIGEKIKLVRTLTDNDEGRYVADAIAEHKLRYHYSNKDFAILYRTNAQSRSFEESLRRMNIPYRIYGGLSFYQRKEIKDFIAYLRVVANPRDEEAIKRIINYPVRGIGKTSLEKLTIVANESGKPLWEVLQSPMSYGLKGAAAASVEVFVTLIKSAQIMLQTHNAYDVAFATGKHSGVVKELYADKSVEGLQRYENVQELLNSIKEYTETPNADGELEEDKSLGTYLQNITLLTDADKDNEEDQDVVKLMTIHAAKGLEFSCTFAVGLEENLFPSAMSMYSREDLEEERRLFYVVVTRAKDRLWITFANSRYRFGQLVQNDPSRFIEEVPQEYIDKSYAGMAGARGTVSSAQTGGNFSTRNPIAAKTPAQHDRSNIVQAKKPAASNYTHTPSADFVASEAGSMQVGFKVEHQKFGFGVIRGLDGNPNNRMATIDFENGVGVKKIMLQYAKLKIVD